MEITLIAGLGNPGKEYRYTRHNIGFLMIDNLLNVLSGKFREHNKFNSIYWEGRVKGRPLLLQKPLTFMNESGNAVAALLAHKKLLPEELMLIYDDVNLPLGKIRLRTKGSSGGHNGVQSVIDKVGTNRIARLRIGIGGTPEAKEAHSIKNYVLSTFTEHELKIVNETLKIAEDAVKLVLFRGFEVAMNRFNNQEDLIIKR